MHSGERYEKCRMDKVYRQYKEAKMNPKKLMDELGIDFIENSNCYGMGVIRKETELNNEEKHFLLAVERGDIPTARHCLEESQIYFNININCVDTLGRSALLIAIENENIEMIELLLRYNIEVGDALLHAIGEENVEAVELLLSHQQSNKKDLSGFLGGIPSSSFTPDITPIIMAAHKDNYEILKILLDRGDRILKPHDVRCSCTECVSKGTEDSLNHSQSRINAYRALASSSLICLSSKDPILTAFELSWELKRLSRLENEFKVDYEMLSKQTQDFAVALLNQIRGSKELKIVLNHTDDGPISDTGEHMNLSRLKLAIKYKQKKFVAHPNCQQLLGALWYEGLPGFRRRHIIFKVLLTVSVCLMYPFMSTLYIFVPKSGIGRFMGRPFIKFICHSAAYMYFLFLLILTSQRIESVIGFAMSDEESKRHTVREVRGARPTSIEWMILAYVIGLVWAEVKQLWVEGARAYIQDMWNILDFITNSLYIATFTLKLVAFLRVEEEKRNNNPAATMAREDWDAYDPNLISEGLFAAANIFSFLKLIYFFTVNPHLGPLQITLGRMVMDIMKFGVLAVLVVFSYACGVNQLYWYYAEQRLKECNACLELGEDNCECDKTLSNLFEILQTLYFAIYGLVDIKHFELKAKHDFTQFVGKLMFGTYSLITIVVLLNMLIAMLSNSYQYISNDSDTEWKYARSKLWMSYFEDGGTVPPPFNVIPTPKMIWYIGLWFKDKLCRCTKKHQRNKWQSIRKLVKKISERDVRYQAVMRDLIKRYIMQRQHGSQTQGVTEDDINEIKQDINSFRYELLEILHNSGMKTPSYTNQTTKQKNKMIRRKGSHVVLGRMGMKVTETIPENSNSSDSDVPWNRTQTMAESYTNVHRSRTHFKGKTSTTPVANSTVANSTVANSTVANSTVANSTVANSTVANSTVANSTVANGTKCVATEDEGLGESLDLGSVKSENSFTTPKSGYAGNSPVEISHRESDADEEDDDDDDDDDEAKESDGVTEKAEITLSPASLPDGVQVHVDSTRGLEPDQSNPVASECGVGKENVRKTVSFSTN